MLYAIEVAITNGKDYHQPEAYQRISSKFKITTDLTQDIYRKMREVDDTYADFVK